MQLDAATKTDMKKILLRNKKSLLTFCYALVVAAVIGTVGAARAETDNEAEADTEAGTDTDTDTKTDTEADVPEHPLARDNFSVTIWLTTDYVDRGLSNTDEGPAVQASLDWTYKGFYLGVWGSNTSYSDADIEIDYYGGYAWDWKGLSLDVGVLYYYYPGEDANRGDGLDPDGGQEADYWETSFAVSHEFEVGLSPIATLTYFYSPDFFGEDGTAHALKGDLQLSLPYEFKLGLETGYQDVAGDKLSTGYDYLWWRIGMSRDIAGFNLDLSYHEVDDQLEACDVDLCDARLVFTVSREF